ncbi:MAG: RNA polymerase sigma factor [Burkholderiaceae bacterium]
MAFDPSACTASALAQQPSVLDANEHVDEQHLLRSASSGDERAFTALYRRHEAAVYRFALLLTGSATQAADVTQDVFVELLSASNGYDPARGSLAAYLCGIARFRAYRAMDSRLQSVDDFDAQTEVHTAYDAPAMPCERLERSRALQMLYGAIRKLPPIFRDVLILVELQEMSYADTAAIAGIELGTVRSRLSRAKARLAQLLNEQSE